MCANLWGHPVKYCQLHGQNAPGEASNVEGVLVGRRLTCTGDRWLPADVYAMRVNMVAVLTIRADDINVRLSAMFTRSKIRCSAARTATHTHAYTHSMTGS